MVRRRGIGCEWSYVWGIGCEWNVFLSLEDFLFFGEWYGKRGLELGFRVEV